LIYHAEHFLFLFGVVRVRERGNFRLGDHDFLGLGVFQMILIRVLRLVLFVVSIATFLFVWIVIIFNHEIQISIQIRNKILRIIDSESHKRKTKSLTQFLTLMTDTIDFLLRIIHLNKQKKFLASQLIIGWQALFGILVTLTG